MGKYPPAEGDDRLFDWVKFLTISNRESIYVICDIIIMSVMRSVVDLSFHLFKPLNFPLWTLY